MSEELILLSGAVPGHQEEYRQWYVSRHLPDMRRVPGVVAGQISTATESSPDRNWTVLSRYRLTGSVGEVVAAIAARLGTEDLPLTDAIDRDSVLMMAASPLGARVVAPSGNARNDGLLYFVLTNAEPGQDDAFNRWYSDRHIDDVLAVPGFIAAQRFRLAAASARQELPWRYLAIYEVVADQASQALAELGSRADTEAMPLSPSLNRSNIYTALFRPVVGGF